MKCATLQTEASRGVEGESVEERLRGAGRDLRAGLRQGGQQGWRRHLGGAAPLQTGVGHPKIKYLTKYVKKKLQKIKGQKIFQFFKYHFLISSV